MAEVRLEGVTKIFKDTIAVSEVDLQVDEGEFFSLLGPSGCGKTTTLRMIGGFEDPTEGSIYLGGKDVTTLLPYKRDVNTVFQSYALFPHLNVFENVAYGLKRKGVDAREIRQRVESILELVDLSRFKRRRKSQLSGGQQQRVALARALVNRPQVLLLDEPLGALDLKLRKQMQLELKRIQQEVGITFIYVTHDQEEAMTMSDRLAVMNGGRLEQVGPPQEVYEYPRTAFVAAFLGASNLIDGEIESVSGDVGKIRLGSGEIVSAPAARLPSRRGPVQVGVRPEKLHIHPPGDPAHVHGNSLQATVELSTYTGVATSYACRTRIGSEIHVYAQNASGDAEPVAVGETVLLTWDPAHTFAVIPSTAERPYEEEAR